MKVYLPLVALSLVLGACQPPQKSSPLEYIDSANSLLEHYGLAEMPNYESIKAQSLVFTATADGQEILPWTDTYWPTTYKGLAQRWGAFSTDQTENLDPEADFVIGSFYAQTQKAAASEGLINVHLSPAEKFDLLYQELQGLDPQKSQELAAGFAAIDSDLRKLLEQPQLEDQVRLQKKRELAARYANQLYASDASGLRLSNYFPMTTEGLGNWLAKAKNRAYQFPGDVEDGQDWSWEGLCHGWAPAAVMAKEPAHAVRVRMKQDLQGKARQLLFTEGDIRGLLTKSWAQASNNDMFFIGRRCEQNVADVSLGVEKNASGRGVGGEFTLNDTKTRFTLVQEYPRAKGVKSLLRVVLEDEWSGSTPSFAYLIQDLTTGMVHFTREEKNAFAAIETQDVSKLTEAQYLQFYGCWDVNPASFHTVLLENLGGNNRGFVMDRTQSGQVWNQPVYKSQFTIGELIPVAEFDKNGKSDVAKAYRAPGTAFIANVTAQVSWAREPDTAHFTYKTNDGSDLDAQNIETTEYTYSLEFDAQHRLIGGEWGSSDSFEAYENPDFLFGFRQASEPKFRRGSEYLRLGYEKIIKKIHDCSLSSRTDGELKLPDPSDETTQLTLKYTDCAL